MELSDDCILLWNRAGFGIPLNELNAPRSKETILSSLLRIPDPIALEVVSEEEWQQTNPKALKASGLEGDALQMRLKSFRQKGTELGVLWMQNMVTTDHPFQEKMALFWHGHFATRADNPYFDQVLLQVFRAQGFGNFKELLFAVSQSQGMLKFLNNQQNRKSHPNENFARELMELFTLGRGNYTEKDVKEAARAFTGWGFDEDGAFRINEKQHDPDLKNFLGKSGNFNGEDILNIILEQKQTAHFITAKLYRYFVNEEREDPAVVNELAEIFRHSNYDIRILMRAMLSHESFYAHANRGAHIKSPVELLVGMQRSIPLEFNKDQTLTNLQRILGQQLFYPPNVAGWPGGKSWIDASSLVIRLRLPDAIYGYQQLELRAKEIDAEMMDPNKKPMAPASGKGGQFRVGKADIDWTAYIDYWQPFDEKDLPRKLARFLIAIPIAPDQLNAVVHFSSSKSKEDFIKTLSIRLMSLPEYQLS